MKRPTSAAELNTWAEKNIPEFIGIFARDALPPLSTPGASFIINLDPHYSKGGTHWTAVRVLKVGGSVVYFDPFGEHPPSNVTLNAWRNGRGLLRSDVPYQAMKEKNCGPRCLAALYTLAHAKDDLEAFKVICNERP